MKEELYVGSCNVVFYSRYRFHTQSFRDNIFTEKSNCVECLPVFVICNLVEDNMQ